MPEWELAIKTIMDEVFTQRLVDISKKPGTTDVFWLQYIYAAFNAAHDAGVLDPLILPDEVFTQVGSWFDEHGYPVYQALWNTADGEGDFASWPITYHAP